MLKHCGRYKDKNVILGLLDRFSIAAEVPADITFPGELSVPKKNRVFMVLSLLIYDKAKAFQKAKGNIVVVFCAPERFLPEMVLNKLLVRTISWCYYDRNHQVYRYVCSRYSYYIL